MRRLFQFRSARRRTLLAIAFVGFLAAVYTAYARSGGMEALIVYEQRLRGWIETHALTAFVVGTAIYAAVSLIPGTSGKAVAAGWLYGFWKGVLLVEIGLSTTAMLTFLFSRHVLGDLIRSRYAAFLQRLDTHLLSRGGLNVLALRWAHVPYTILNYTLGATAISPRTFLWTTALGLLPGTVVFVFAGMRLPTLAELAEQGAWRLLDPWLLGALALSAIAVPLARCGLSFWTRWWRGAARGLPE